MKTLNIPLEDKEYEKLSKTKGNKTWHNFVMELVNNQPTNQPINQKKE